MECESCHADAVLVFEPRNDWRWGVCLDCAIRTRYGSPAVIERMAQAIIAGLVFGNNGRISRKKALAPPPLRSIEKPVGDAHFVGTWPAK